MKKITYALYSHLGFKEASDFKKWNQSNGKNFDFETLDVIQHLRLHLPGLRDLLTLPRFEGILVLFYAPGLTKCLDSIAAGKSKQEILNNILELSYAREVAKSFGTIITTEFPELKNRLRFVIPTDLYDIFGRMKETENLRWYFIGETEGIRYDTPKIIEAFVRLRLLGTGIPVLRLDHDVLFRGKRSEDNPNGNSNLPQLNLFQIVASCLVAYQSRRENSAIASFMFSGSYKWDSILRDSTFTPWSQAFATRIYPALPVDMNLSKEVEANKIDWSDYANKVFDQSVALKFYGLRITGDRKLLHNGVSGIGKIGANPLVSVISGAMLCLSDGAILDLPPFSNFDLNVMWIDDHLKYCLHRELQHFSPPRFPIEDPMEYAKIDSLMAIKARPKVSNLPQYVLGVYLPTLLWGTVMDAWITSDPRFKYRPENLNDKDRNEVLNSKFNDGVLVKALKSAIRKGSFDKGSLNIQAELRQVAFQRITEARRDWVELTTNEDKETFISLWAKGHVGKDDFYPRLYNDPFFSKWDQEEKKSCMGIVRKGTHIDEKVDIDNINPHLNKQLNKLIQDALEYIEWVLEWPKIVQVVRSVDQGKLRIDLPWKHKSDQRNEPGTSKIDRYSKSLEKIDF